MVRFYSTLNKTENNMLSSAWADGSFSVEKIAHTTYMHTHAHTGLSKSLKPQS